MDPAMDELEPEEEEMQEEPAVMMPPIPISTGPRQPLLGTPPGGPRGPPRENRSGHPSLPLSIRTIRLPHGH